jgi:hypothetical protein
MIDRLMLPGPTPQWPVAIPTEAVFDSLGLDSVKLARNARDLAEPLGATAAIMIPGER